MRYFRKIILIVLLIILFALSFWHFNLKIFLADIYFQQTRSFDKWPEMLKAHDQVLLYQPREPYYQKQFALDLIWSLDLFYQDQDLKIKVLNLAIERMEEIPVQDQIFEVKVYLARIYTIKANLTQLEQDFLKAEEMIIKVAEISPQMAVIYNDWCQLKIYQKKWEEAKEMCRKALSLYPPLDHPQMTQDHRVLVMAEMSQVYEKFGHIYTSLGNYQKAEQLYLQVLKFFPLGKPYIWKKMGDLYYLQGDIGSAIQKNLHGYTLDPNDPVWTRALYLLYLEKGDLESAEIWQEKLNLNKNKL